MTIEVLQTSAWYGPRQVGGTEVYVEGLVEALSRRGVVSTVVTPRAAGAPARYLHAGTVVETYPVGEARPAEMRGAAPHDGFESFQNILAAHPGAIYHQHSWTRGCGLAHLKAARAQGLRTVLTIHVAAATCLRGTMLRFGTTPCDGRVEAVRCGACWAEGRGAPRPLAGAAARLPLGAARLARRAPTRLATALAARAIGAERERQVREMAAAADRVVAVCGWLAEALRLSGVPGEKLQLSRQGVPEAFAEEAGRAPAPAPGPLSMLFLGRWDRAKGVDILVRAVRATPADLRLTIRGVAQDEDARAYEAEVRTAAGDDPRIRFAPPVARDGLAAEMARHDVLAVPSIAMETGPLVAIEARAAGLFVLGSRLGGIAELLREDGDGELVAPGDVAAWTRAIEALAARGVRRGAPAPSRTMAEVADEMAALYRELAEPRP